MKNLFSFINEYKGHAIRDKEKSIGDPDEIQHFFGQGWVKLKFNKDNAYPFVYNKKLDKIILGSANSIHNNIFTSNNADKLKEMGLDGVDNVRQLRYCCGMDDDTEEIDRWYEENKKYVDETICGRIWYNAQDDFESWDSEEQAAQMAELFGDLKDLDSSKCYVANWNEIEPNEFKEVLDNIVKHFSKEHNKKIKSYIAIDNNGEPIELELGNNDVKIDKRSSDHEKEIEHAWQYHTDTSAHGRAKKRELTHGWIKSRDEHFQKTRYNHTDSKTAAEFHNKFTKRYDAKSGKYVWGEKIGDSLQMKSIKDYIAEGFSTPDVFYIKNGPSVNWKMDNAYPFFYNTKTDKIFLSEKGNETHHNMIEQLIKDLGCNKLCKEFDIDLDEDEIKRIIKNEDFIDSETEAIEEVMYNNAEWIVKGRTWIITTHKLAKYIYNEDDDVDEARETSEIKIKDSKDPFTLFIALWSEFPENKIKQCCNNIIKELKRNVNRLLNVSEYYFIDSYGDWEIVKKDKDAEVSAANLHDEEMKKFRAGLKAIHLASQREKKEFFKDYNKSRTEHFQREYYNKTKSKTAAEWHHTKTKRYNPITGKMEWGEKIGDSLQVKTIKDYICEAKNGCFINFVNVVFFDNKPIAAMKNLTIGEIDEHTAKITINKNNKPYFEIYSKENDKDIKLFLQQCAGIITQTDDNFPMGEIISKDETNNSFVYELDNKKITVYFNKL